MLLNDTLIVITPLQLKQTNIIFLEHKKYKLLNSELEKQIIYYNQLYMNYCRMDSINRFNINILEDDLKSCNIQLNAQKKTINNQKFLIKTIGIGGLIVSATLLVLLLVR